MAMVAANTLSAIAIEMRQLQNKIQERRIVLNFFLRNVRTKNFAIKEVHIDVAKEIIRAWEETNKVSDAKWISNVHCGRD